MREQARAALDEIGIHIPSLDARVGRLSGGQRQAIAVARTIATDADILLLDEPLAAMGAKEGAMILDVIARVREQRRVSMIIIAHNYAHIMEILRPDQPDPGRPHRARHGDRRHLGDRPHRDRGRRVQACARHVARRMTAGDPTAHRVLSGHAGLRSYELERTPGAQPGRRHGVAQAVQRQVGDPGVNQPRDVLDDLATADG